MDGSARCANVCFFNALIQVLVSIPDYCNYIIQSDLDNAVVTNLKRLFSVINDSDNPAHTYPYVHELEIPHYRPNDQYDACECLSHILDNSYPGNLKNQSVFNINCDVIMQCECSREYRRTEDELFFKLDTDDDETFGSVQLLLDKSISLYGCPNRHYQCRGDLINEEIIPGIDPGCQRRGSCTEFRTLEIFGDFLIIVLQLFRYDDNHQPYKVTPDIMINLLWTTK